MSQKIEHIKVKDLVLWTENPRDPILASATDDEVIERAIKDPNNKWDLHKLAHEMGTYYDLSELPIVVYKDDKPVVFDGNRRVVLAKIKLGLVSASELGVILPDVPEDLPCNVCSEDIALQSVYRKHVTLRNSWGALERDIFANKYLHESKSVFLMFDEATNGFISNNPEMNQGFVRKEVLTDSILIELGLSVADSKLRSKHSDDETWIILNNLLEKIRSKEISTRGEYRGKPFEVLDQRVKDILSSNKNNALRECSSEIPLCKRMNDSATQQKEEAKHKTRITQPIKIPFFGGVLALKSGEVNNLYSDIQLLYNTVMNEKKTYSSCIHGLFRMSLRLLCETAAKDLGYTDIKAYINKFYKPSKKKLSQDITTYLSSQNVKEETLPQLLHTGAHNYISSTSQDQALCISIILGAMLQESHGRK